MDIVIPLHEWTGTDNAELRYAIRSFEKFMPADNIVLVGYQPKWIKNVIHLPYRDDPSPYFREANIFLKLKLYIDKLNDAEDFIYANDDHFLLRAFDPTPPYPQKGALLDAFFARTADDPYRKTIDNTIKLGSNKQLNFDVHAPMLMNPKIFYESFDIKENPLVDKSRVDWSKKYGYLLKTLYAANKFSNYPTMDAKLNEPLTLHNSLSNTLAQLPFFSCSDKAWNEVLENMLQRLFPDKSKYEI